MSTTLRPEAARRTTGSFGATRPASGLVQALFLLTVLVLFTLSGGVLWYAGYNYDGLTGNATITAVTSWRCWAAAAASRSPSAPA